MIQLLLVITTTPFKFDKNNSRKPRIGGLYIVLEWKKYPVFNEINKSNKNLKIPRENV